MNEGVLNTVLSRAAKRARKRVDAFVGRSNGTRRQIVDGRSLPKAVSMRGIEMEITAGAAIRLSKRERGNQIADKGVELCSVAAQGLSTVQLRCQHYKCNREEAEVART